MITNGLLMLGVLLALSCVLIVLERTTGWKLFKFVPGMVLMYLLCATLNSFGVFGDDDATRAPIEQVKDVLLPAMIFLFLFGCDLRKIIRLGPKLLLTFFVAALSLTVGMIGVYAVFPGLPAQRGLEGVRCAARLLDRRPCDRGRGAGHPAGPESIFGYA